jgi:hypothetical protein
MSKKYSVIGRIYNYEKKSYEYIVIIDKVKFRLLGKDYLDILSQIEKLI